MDIHCDASHMAHKQAGKGHTGFYVTLGSKGSYPHGRSCKQKLTAISSTDAEILAALDAVKFSMWMRNLLAELQITPLQQMTLLQDNQSAMLIEAHPSNKRTAHLTSKLRFVEEQISGGLLKTEHVPTADLAADLLTKPLQGSQYTKHSDKLLGRRWERKFGGTSKVVGGVQKVGSKLKRGSKLKFLYGSRDNKGRRCLREHKSV